ncbi:PD-(D/E)XK nuclease family protein [Rhodoferax mekongensis]|uniref:PD-(D/E)XK nuclease family protein n=2 Tax=Rhodoferax mekongensis TaxID=3068341 RepID=A0ABZ0AUF2_9BURK|nr:PD-(D/E)XK nuclease family protein [Rhodoferax sp. TBRC 17307]WNO03291.1 PD-(D/E)XK nuclease family protein [Rhodoferax sp. TBRC 17307]
MALWSAPGIGLVHRLQAWMTQSGAHPGRTLVLLPYAQLLPLARRVWSDLHPQGFSPRFETTSNWLASMSARRLQATDISQDMALDTLTAQQLLAQAGMGAESSLAGLLAEAAQQLAPWAAAAGPQGRGEWASQARAGVSAGMESQALAWEARVARIAVEWAAVSSYSTDVLFDSDALEPWDAVALVQGLVSDPVSTALKAHWGSKAELFRLDSQEPEVGAALKLELDHLHFHACADAEDEAQRAAACAIAHVAADRYPLALVSSDRALTRRVRAMLESAGIAMRDENGWKLSTSRAGAALMALLRAAVWNASTDAVLNAFKQAPAFAADLQALEQALRKEQVRDWRHVSGCKPVKDSEALRAMCVRIDQVRTELSGSRPLPVWLARMQAVLQTCGWWEPLQADEAGAMALGALQLTQPEPQVWADYVDAALWAGTRMDLSAFSSWVNQVLEAHSFQPAYPDEEQVVILPMSQMLARPFAAVVLAGCDEVRLNPSPEPSGIWTPAQRAALGMPSRKELEARLRASWRQALQAPAVEVLWRSSDDTGEHIAASPLVQWLRLQPGAQEALASDPRTSRQVMPAPVLPPTPHGDRLSVRQLSASAYEDLRTCPYRFFALRQLGLKTVDELESDVDKRDFGLWLHAVLQEFHTALQTESLSGLEPRSTLLEACANSVTASMGLPDGEFLPFAAAWPHVRDGYLQWLEKHEAQGWTYASGETAHTQTVGSVMLMGRIDRTDTGTGGAVMVLDYKTEPAAKTKERVKNPLEDTQIAFYAALLPHDTLQAAYINVGERDGTVPVEQKDIVLARDALVEGIISDMARLAAGEPLPALGDGVACDYCQARGLCRKDFWSAP